MNKTLAAPLLSLALLAGCNSIEKSDELKVIPQEVESRNTLGSSSDPQNINMALQAATEKCQREGKKIVVIDTRTSAYSGVGAIQYGDIKYICAPE